MSFRDVLDGTANTIAVGEIATDLGGGAEKVEQKRCQWSRKGVRNEWYGLKLHLQHVVSLFYSYHDG